jgi:hypothetical protein
MVPFETTASASSTHHYNPQGVANSARGKGRGGGGSGGPPSGAPRAAISGQRGGATTRGAGRGGNRVNIRPGIPTASVSNG